MQLEQYSKEAWAFANHDLPHDRAIHVWGLGLAGESGEICDLIKKYLGHGHSLDRGLLIKEIGDLIWYVNAMALQLGKSIPLFRASHDRQFQTYIVLAKAEEKQKQFDSAIANCAFSVSNEVGGISAVLFWGNADTAAWAIPSRLATIASRIATLCAILDIDIADVLDANIAKLRDRYSSGKFSTEASINRR